MTDHIDPAEVTAQLRSSAQLLQSKQPLNAEQLDEATEALAWSLRAVRDFASHLQGAYCVAAQAGSLFRDQAIAVEDLQGLLRRLQEVSEGSGALSAGLEQAWSLASPQPLRCAPHAAGGLS